MKDSLLKYLLWSVETALLLLSWEVKHFLNIIVCEQVTICVFVGSCLATKVFIGNLPDMGRGRASDERRSTTNKSVT